MDGRDIGERSDAVLRTAMPGHDERWFSVRGDERSVVSDFNTNHPFCPALISLNFSSACSNLTLNSHIASRISRKFADVLARSAWPKVKTLLLRRYPMIRGSEISV